MSRPAGVTDGRCVYCGARVRNAAIPPVCRQHRSLVDNDSEFPLYAALLSTALWKDLTWDEAGTRLPPVSIDPPIADTRQSHTKGA